MRDRGQGADVVANPHTTVNLGLGLSVGALGPLLIGLRPGVCAGDLGLERLQSLVHGRRLLGLDALTADLQLAGPDLALLLVERQGLNRGGCRKCRNWTSKST